MTQRGFRFGEWTVDVAGNALVLGDVRQALEPRAMDVLRYLCRHPGAVIPAEEILQACWGTAELGDNPIHKAIAQLRRALGDSSTEPRYIETVRKRGYRAIADVVEEEEQAGVWQDGSPFRGLEAFEENHAAIFFGRMQATTQLRETVLKQASSGSAMALVLGPSGSGKTSLVRAGLLPQLVGGEGPVALSCLLHMDCADLGGGDLFGALAAVLVDAELDGVHLFDGSSAEALAERLRTDPLSVAAQFDDGTGPVRIAVFIDRLEAIFRAPNTSDADRARFIALLDLLATHRVLVLLACRNDFYPELIALPELMALKARGGHFDLEPPDGADIAQMIRLPARAAGLTFEIDPTTGASLDDVLCDEARGSPDALPLLQYCLNELYRQRSEDGVLRFAVFRQLGGIEGALGVRAEQIVSALPASQQGALPHVLSLLVSVGEEQNAVTARRAAWTALQGDAERQLVTALVEARLFVSELTGDVSGFGVAHEALLRRWPRVVDWIERHREALQVRTRIAAQADRWLAADKPVDLLLPRGTPLQQAQEMLSVVGPSISVLHQEFIQSSLRRARSFSRLRTGLISSLLGLCALSIVLGFSARTAQLKAERHRTTAESLMTYTLGEFVEKLRPLGRMDLLESVSRRALNDLSQLDADEVDDVALAQRAKTLQLIAEVHIARAASADATKALLAARKVLQQLEPRRGTNKDFLLDLGANAFWLGQVAFDKGDLRQAWHHFSEYLTLANRLAQLDNSDSTGWIEQSYAHSNLGTVATSLGLLNEANEHFTESVKLKERTLNSKPNDESKKADLANGISWLASTKVRLGHLKPGLDLYQQEESILLPLARASDSNAAWKYRLAVSIWRTAELRAALGDLSGSHAKFVEAQTLLKKVIEQDPSNKTWQIDLLKTELKDFAITSLVRASPERLKQAEQLQKRLEEFVRLAPDNLEALKTSAVGLQQLGEEYARRGRISEAYTAVSDAALQLDSLHSSLHDDIPVLAALGAAKISKAKIADARGAHEEALAECKAVQTLLSAKAVKSSDYNLLVPLARALICTRQIDHAAEIQRILLAAGFSDPRFTPLAFN